MSPRPSSHRFLRPFNAPRPGNPLPGTIAGGNWSGGVETIHPSVRNTRHRSAATTSAPPRRRPPLARSRTPRRRVRHVATELARFSGYLSTMALARISRQHQPSCLVAGFHLRFGPPSSFVTTLTAFASLVPAMCFNRSRSWGSVRPFPLDGPPFGPKTSRFTAVRVGSRRAGPRKAPLPIRSHGSCSGADRPDQCPDRFRIPISCSAAYRPPLPEGVFVRDRFAWQ
jgi:hypothetical protein